MEEGKMFTPPGSGARRHRRAAASAPRPRLGTAALYRSGFGRDEDDEATDNGFGRRFPGRGVIVGVVALLVVLTGLVAVPALSGPVGHLVDQVLPADRIVDIQMQPRKYSEPAGREVRVRGSVRNVADIPLTAARAVLVADETGEIWVRTAQC